MKINWVLLGFVALNLTFSTIGDICAKLWGLSNGHKWFYIGLAVNLITIAAFMAIVRLGGLAIATSVVLILTIMINVFLGYIIFHEKVTPGQWFGVGLGLIAILLILEVFKFNN